MKKILAGLVVVCLMVGCSKTPVAQSISGVEMAKVGKVDVNSNGHTIEQQNLIERIKADNKLDAIKHLYVVSAYSGQVLIYSSVKGKVTSGGKRLNPKYIDGTFNTNSLPYVMVGGQAYTVKELANEDGTYGTAAEGYIFWFDQNGRYHQHYLGGGQIVHISDQPLVVKNIVINVEQVKE